MAGLTPTGFEVQTYEETKEKISSRLLQQSPNMDLSAESPDGQLVDIFSLEISEAWLQLAQVYDSYNPRIVSGIALRNIGLITGHPYGTASRSVATVELQGTSGTIIPLASEVSDDDGNIFQTEYITIIPAIVNVIAQQAGPVPVPSGSITNIVNPIVGWDAVVQDNDGALGRPPQTDNAYRVSRNRTTQRQHVGTEEVIYSRLIELGITQAKVINNITGSTLPDGTPDKNIHVTLRSIPDVSDEDVARTILNANAVGTGTYGSTTVNIDDSQGVSQPVSFSKAVEVPILITMNITYLSVDFAGSSDAIKRDLISYISNLLAGEDVIWSRLFPSITPYGKAQVNELLIGIDVPSLDILNIVIQDTEYASLSEDDITIVVTP